MHSLAAQLAILFIVGLCSGFINILAGGGSLLTLPVMIFLGMPAAMANGTNRIAILLQNLFAIASFHRHKVFPWKVSVMASIPAIVGAVLGAQLALEVPDELFKRILAVLMLAVLAIILIDPGKRIRAESKPITGKRLVLFAIGFFLVGLYGGFIQAGVGFLVIPIMLLAGFDLVATNAVKVIVILIFTVAALAVFIANSQVDYVLGAALGAGSAVGGVLATHFAVRKGHAWIRGFVIVAVIVFAVQLFLDSIW